jgi:hypothetical protein
MKQITGWWFVNYYNRLANGDGREIKVGETHAVEGEIVPCRNGLHLSKLAIDALKYAPGPIVYKVRGSGEIVPHGVPVDKFACRRRTYLAGGVDCADVLHKFARMCALDVVHLWDAPQVVQDYLSTGDEDLRDEAWAATRAATMRMGVVWGATRAAAWASALAAIMDRDTPWTAARTAARTLRAAARDAQNERLTKTLNDTIGGGCGN